MYLGRAGEWVNNLWIAKLILVNRIIIPFLNKMCDQWANIIITSKVIIINALRRLNRCIVKFLNII